jgi:hypothetical protein
VSSNGVYVVQRRQLHLTDESGARQYKTSRDYISMLSGGTAAISSPLQGQVFKGGSTWGWYGMRWAQWGNQQQQEQQQQQQQQVYL